MTQTFRYRAFLSYSHKDKTWAEWLHKALEGFSLGSNLAGRETPAGIVPKTLRPVFRDRDDFSAGHSLGAQTLEALSQSHSMVVLCSPNSAKSPYVNEEIRAFKALGREVRVFAVIIDGEPGDAARECFPPALRFKVDADGQMTNERLEPIAADARSEGDGKRIALVKIVAGITGLPFNDIRKREVEAHRRLMRLRIGLAASLAALSLTTGWFWWQGEQKQVQIVATQDLLTKMLEAARAQGIALSPEQQTALAKTLGAATAQALAGDKFTAEALNLIKVGRVKEGIEKYKSAAENTEKSAKNNKIIEIYYRQLADLAKDIDPETSLRSYKKVIELNQNDLGAIQFYAFAMKEKGLYFEAKEYANLLLEKSKLYNGSSYEYASLILLGDIDTIEYNYSNALVRYKMASAIIKSISDKNPENDFGQREYSVSLERIGDTQLNMGLPDLSLNTYEKRHAIALHLYKKEPNNKQFKRDLLVSFTKLSESCIEIDEYSTARNHIVNSLNLAKQINSQNYESYQSNADLSKAYNVEGHINENTNRLSEALESFENSNIYGKAAEMIAKNTALNEIMDDNAESHNRVVQKLNALKKRPATQPKHSAPRARSR